LYAYGSFLARLHGHRILVAVREIDAFPGTVETPVLMLVLRPDDAVLLRAGYDTEAVVLDGCIIQLDPDLLL
jgi:hypothetical protein